MKGLYRIGIIVLINIYLVIVAGSVVRMTGSGMGCPDWPKCFGYLIPPTHEDQIKWKPNKQFNKKQLVIHEVTVSNTTEMQLLVAQKDFTSAQEFNSQNWKKYEKHDYAIFNVYHTWTEYINRLFGALLGVMAFIMLVLSARKWKQDKWLTFISLAQVFFIGFMAWLGKVTVDNNLAPVTITYHMLGVLVLIAIQFYFLKRVKNLNEKTSNPAVAWYYVIIAAIVLLIAQIVLGTQVRQEVDSLLHAGVDRSILAEQFSVMFFIHRSFSIVLVAVIGFIIWKLNKAKTNTKTITILAISLILEVLVGMLLYYLGMKAYGQPLHLLFSLIMFACLIQLAVSLKKK